MYRQADMTAVRASLREQLESRGHRVASDTLGARHELYVVGENDLALALFEFSATTRDAFDTMYSGTWTEGLPPRFAVLPAEAVDDPSFELLDQMGCIPLLFRRVGAAIDFVDLDELLGQHLGA